MEIEIIKNEKNDLEVSLDNSTVSEILRVYLAKKGIEFVAWKREHPTKPVTMKIKGKKKDVSSAVDEIKKDLNKIASLVKRNSNN